MIKSIRELPGRLIRAWREGESDARTHYNGYQAWRRHLANFAIDDVRAKEILEIGCGDRAQLSLLFTIDGARVTALDQRPIALGSDRPRMWLALVRESGVASASRQITRDLVHTLRYWWTLRHLAGRALPFRAVRVLRGDASALPFEAESFDLIVSSAVWEHLSDVNAATGELARVLRKDGLAAVQIALFPSLPGGHHAEWHSTEIRRRRSIRPWDHLRPNRMTLPTYLNEWKESEYQEAFNRWVDVLEWEDGPKRGSDFLNDRIREQLAQFTERDLILSSITVWAKAKP